QVTTFAGGHEGSTDGVGAAAGFAFPADFTGLAIDSGNLYVADTRNATIRKITLASAQVSTFAGQAGSTGSSDGVGEAARFNEPTGLASDGTYLYVSDSVNMTVRRIDLRTAEVTTIVGSAGGGGFADGPAAQAGFERPSGLALGDGSLYMA